MSLPIDGYMRRSMVELGCANATYLCQFNPDFRLWHAFELPYNSISIYTTLGGFEPTLGWWWVRKLASSGYTALGVRMPLWSMVQSLFSMAYRGD